MKYRILKDRNKMMISLNPDIYSLEAIYGACYVFIDRAYIFLDGNPKKEIKVSIKGKNRFSPKAFEKLFGEFQNELLNYTLRERINKNNSKIREYIVGRALYATSDFLSEEKIYDYQKDPLGIAIPWEEKYGKDKAK